MKRRHFHMVRPYLLLMTTWLISSSFSGCLSPITLERSVVAYDNAVTNSLTEQILINIARAHNHEPVHFTGVSNIAATFNFQVSAGATPPLGGASGGVTLSPIFGGSVAENPTISIVPIEGERGIHQTAFDALAGK